MASPYDEAMRIIVEIVQSQMMWPSCRMLKLDLDKALTTLVKADRDGVPK